MNLTHFDYFGQPIKIGGGVALAASYSPVLESPRTLVTGRVIAFSQRHITLTYRNTWDFGSEGKEIECTIKPEFVIRVPD